jgi:hypothetical protein
MPHLQLAVGRVETSSLCRRGSYRHSTAYLPTLVDDSWAQADAELERGGGKKRWVQGVGWIRAQVRAAMYARAWPAVQVDAIDSDDSGCAYVFAHITASI